MCMFGTLVALIASAAVRRLELTATEAAVTGRYSFPGGEPEATCKACHAVMEHVQRSHLAHIKNSSQRATRSVDAARRDRMANIQALLDPRSCRAAMSHFQLVRASESSNEGLFQYQEAGETTADTPTPTGVPSDPDEAVKRWARHELVLICETMLEEYEVELAELLASGVLEESPLEPPSAPGVPASGLPQLVCKQKLTLCVTVRHSSARPRGRPPLPHDELDRVQSAFFALDKDMDGALSRKEVARLVDKVRKQQQTDPSQKEPLLDKPDYLHNIFSTLDTNRDGSISMREYMGSWIAGSVARMGEGGEKGLLGDAPALGRFQALRVLLGSGLGLLLRDLGILVITIATVYLCGLVFRLW